MANPFVQRFTGAIVRDLLDSGMLLLAGPEEEVVQFVSAELGSGAEGRSLVSTLSRALVACPAVEELFADDQELKRRITEIPREALGR